MSIRSLPMCLAIALGAMFSARAASAAPPAAAKTVVLVHGAFADGSSWNAVIPLLQAKGLKVIAVQNPLSSLADDVAFTQRAITEANGPVVLVGHSWGGSVITEAGASDQVKALVYIAAFAPDAGQSSMDTLKPFPPSPGLSSPLVDTAGYVKLSADAFAKYFAQDVPAAQARVFATSQGAVRGKNFEEKLTKAEWQNKPTYYVVTDKDLMLSPEFQRATAAHIKAKVTTLPTSHVPMVSRPKEVADVIIAAATAP
jgi:pimeloyl-ACP methyl ester carboxylesterase